MTSLPDIVSWKPHPGPYIVAPEQVDLWLARLDTFGDVERRYMSLLSLDELERASSFRFDSHRDAFCIGRGLLRLILARYLSVAPQKIYLQYSAYGRPALGGKEAGVLEFNLAHSGEWVLYAISLPRRIGVDIERVQTRDDLMQLAQSFFASEEIQSLLALPAEQRASAFYACWTRKEAFIKALGKGLSYPLDGFCVSVAPGETARLLAVRDGLEIASNWSLFDIPFGPDYRAALALDGPVRKINYWDCSDIS